MLRLETFGGLSLSDGTRARVTTQRRRLALLALLGVAGERGLSRDKLIGCLWPESTSHGAHHSLEQLLYTLRRQLDDAIFVGTDPLALSSAVITCDVSAFEAALARGAPAEAVALYRAPFLDGFFLTEAPEFESWVEGERARFARQYAGALEHLAESARRTHAYGAEVEWRRKLATLDPLSAQRAVQFMRALAAAGDRASAMQHARTYESLVRVELGADPDPAIAAFAAELRTAGGPVPVGARVADEPSRSSPTLASDDVPVDSPMRVPPYRRWRVLGLGVAGALVAMLALTLIVRAQRRHALDEGGTVPTIVIAPFRVAGGDSSLGYLREGMIDLLATALTGEGGPRAVDPRTTLAAWRQDVRSTAIDPPTDEALRIAKRMGAGQVLLGEVVGTPGALILTATVYRVRDGGISTRTSVQGSQDSLPALVEALAGRVLAGEAREAPHRLAAALSASLPALRAYLDGQIAYRGGRYRNAVEHFDEALRRDSTFAIAGLGLAMSVGWTPEPEDDDRGKALAWGLRDRLSAKDRAILIARIGPRYPATSSAREFIEASERAVSLAPDRAESWFWLGDWQFHQGAQAGDVHGWSRAAVAFRRAVELDSSVAGPLGHLAELAVLSGDTGEARRLGSLFVRADSNSDLADFIRWRVAVGTGDSRTLASLRQRFARMRPSSLLHMLATMQFDGVDLEDADVVASILRRGSLPPSDRETATEALWDLALNRGRPLEALAAGQAWREHRRSADHLHSQRVIEDALFGDGDSSAAEVASRALMRAAPAVVAANAGRPEAFADACTAGLWHASHGQRAEVRTAITLLRSAAMPREAAGIVAESEYCAELLDAMVSAPEQRPGAFVAMRRVDSLARTGPASFPASWPGAENLVIARLLEARGDVRAALQVVRRRIYGGLHPTRFLTSFLQEEGRLAAVTGDTAGAIRAYGHYLALRSDPEATRRAETERVRLALARLAGRARSNR